MHQLQPHGLPASAYLLLGDGKFASHVFEDPVHTQTTGLIIIVGNYLIVVQGEYNKLIAGKYLL
jgi:hypothetical protein